MIKLHFCIIGWCIDKLYTGEMTGTSNGRGGKNPVFPKTEDFDYELSPYTALSRDFRVCIFQSNVSIRKNKNL